MKQLEVQIMGQSYLLGCPEGGDSRLLDAVEKVDTAMCKIRDAGKVKARDRIAVLAALNLAFDVSDRVPGVFPSSFKAAAVPPGQQGVAGNNSGTKPHEPATGGAMPAAGDSGPGRSIDPRLTALLQRLDSTLGQDDRLI